MKFKRPMIDFKERLITSLQDLEYASIYLMVALEEYSKSHNLDSLLNSMRCIAAAKGGTLHPRESTTIDPTALEALITKTFNQEWDEVVQTLGMSFEENSSFSNEVI